MRLSAPTYSHQLALQAAAALCVVFLALPVFAIRAEVLPWREVTAAIGGLAFVFSSFTRQPWWWRIIHALFAPMAWFVSSLEIPPVFFFLAFVSMLLVYRGAVEGRIPLYISNATTSDAISRIVKAAPCLRFVNLGAGLGDVVSRVARACPDTQVTGIENAPLTWLVGRLRSFRRPNCRWLWGNLWLTDLSCFDVTYAFLSPEPMAELWAKVSHEMRPGSLFISNTFAIPEVVADQIIEVDDARRTRLFCYRVRPIKDESRSAPPQPLPESGS
ncbi:MAG: class I SAM-dependent methyltransferase [Propionivibrio sp.]